MTVRMFPGAPTSVKISGPDTINHNSNYSYTCKAEGGNPRPSLRWKVNDVLMAGEEEEGLARLTVLTGEEETQVRFLEKWRDRVERTRKLTRTKSLDSLDLNYTKEK